MYTSDKTSYFHGKPEECFHWESSHFFWLLIINNCPLSYLILQKEKFKLINLIGRLPMSRVLQHRSDHTYKCTSSYILRISNQWKFTAWGGNQKVRFSFIDIIRRTNSVIYYYTPGDRLKFVTDHSLFIARRSIYYYALILSHTHPIAAKSIQTFLAYNRSCILGFSKIFLFPLWFKKGVWNQERLLVHSSEQH